MKRRRKILTAVVSFVTLCAVVFCAMTIGFYARHPFRRWRPDYDRIDISYILEKDLDELTDEDYSVLFAQTGVTRLGIDPIFERGDAEYLLDIQEDYFADYEVRTDNFAFMTCMHDMKETVHVAPLEKGDVLISNSTHFSAFAIGHSAIVVNERTGRIFESAGYGDDGVSSTDSLDTFINRPSFLILRPKLDAEKREEIAMYALNELSGVKYSFFVGVFGKKFPDEIQKTHCAHIIWYAFMHFGYDIDANGGLIVTPHDIANSDMFDLVQVYGFDPEKLWS